MRTRLAEQLGRLREAGSRSDQACVRKCLNKLTWIHCRVAQALTHSFQLLQCAKGVEIELQDDEVIGVEDLQIKSLKVSGREILKVGGDNAVSVTANGRSNDVPIAGIWKCQCLYQVFIALDLPIRGALAH